MSAWKKSIHIDQHYPIELFLRDATFGPILVSELSLWQKNLKKGKNHFSRKRYIPFYITTPDLYNIYLVNFSPPSLSTEKQFLAIFCIFVILWSKRKLTHQKMFQNLPLTQYSIEWDFSIQVWDFSGTQILPTIVSYRDCGKVSRKYFLHSFKL